ncbi:transglycosylase SLT domain-containing protein [uncultured Helicobacter sp.]|uniref:lytic transglycosylase domain-containing protein n=1 Tax=uncultured Helicobacter sp. TaxID=175537 RepID=UPI00374EFD9D
MRCVMRYFVVCAVWVMSCVGVEYYSFVDSDQHTPKILQSFGLGYEFLPEQTDQRDAIESSAQYFLKRFDNSYTFIPIIRNMIAQEGLPQEFLFLAMVESEFIINAKSSKKASGIWQFMPGTAKGLGLEINDYIDERQDPIKSTQAAITYLKKLYDLTGEWYLAMMAYNCGYTRLQKAIEEAGGDSSLQTLLDEDKKYLPPETRNYIRKIVAMSLVFNDADFLKNNNSEYLLNRGATDTLAILKLKSGVPLGIIAQSAGMSLKELRSYNMHFKYAFLPPGSSDKEYNVYLPYEKLARFKQHFDQNYTPNSAFILHKVQKGDTLSSIARQYKTNVNELKRVNGLKSTRLSINQKIVIPIPKKS